jgi:hypothetical protein
MQKRHTLHGAAARIGASPRSKPSEPPNESGARIRSAEASTERVERSIQASIDFAMSELESLEIPYTASAPPLAAEPAQQMPRGMPPLPFVAPHPRNMPPLPAPPSALSLAPAAEPKAPAGPRAALDSLPIAAAARPSRWLLLVALTLGLACLGLAFWMRAR